ncbi:Hypothetical predicted protein [Olea europaea subsp. europaea]|uniref:Uncharacterized protein n=1 Tax=Olea europaea subsp. europaea TaxID=158383 RepID=A0A8S0VBU8_OLEEU|nr:Hypothetical predicted protein [Olea europaea subsp. europaea]
MYSKCLVSCPSQGFSFRKVSKEVPMWVHSLICSLLFAFVVHFCCARDKKIEVAGIVECADCKGSNIKPSQVFSGLHVTIDCMLKNGKVKRRGEGKVCGNGKFKAFLPEGILHEGKLKGKCYAQLQSGSAACPAYSGIEDSRILVFKSKTEGKYILKPKGILKFSSVFCTFDFLWPFFNPISYWQWKKNLFWKYFGQPWFLDPSPPVIPTRPPLSPAPQPSPAPSPTYRPPLKPLLPWFPYPKPPVFKKLCSPNYSDHRKNGWFHPLNWCKN